MLESKHDRTQKTTEVSNQPSVAEDGSAQKTSFTNQGPIPPVAPVQGQSEPSASDLAFGTDEEQEGAGGDHAASSVLRVTASRLNVRTSPTTKTRQNIIGGLDRSY